VHALLRRAGAPDGVVTVAHGGAEAARALMDDARTGAITLTGSAAAGWTAHEMAARRRVPLQAELGGTNGTIVWSDADLAAAAAAVADGAFAQAGQRCTAGRRVIVDARCADAFLDALRAATAALVVGDPADAATQVGPLVSEAEAVRVRAAVERARAGGLRVVEPHTCAARGAFVAPAIVACDDAFHPIVQEELFGPVLVVQPAADFDRAMELLNGVRQGLAAALFSADAERRRRFLDEAQAGILKLDGSTVGAAPDAPFGGWKSSGTGPPEHGDGDLEFLTRPHTTHTVPGTEWTYSRRCSAAPRPRPPRA
jgi:acyl-CoA reductase-like NAD-dependent aldehyde dehydrogenase